MTLRRAAEIAGIIGTAVAVLALILDLWSPFRGDDEVASTTPTATAAPVPTTTATGNSPTAGTPVDGGSHGTPNASTVDYLNAMEPKAGRAGLAGLPEKMPAGVDGRHALTIRCPSNETGDQETPVTYELARQYTAFDADLIAVFDDGKFYDSVGVTPLVGVEQRDGTIRTEAKDPRAGVTAAKPATLDIPVTGAKELTLLITCSQPDGVVLLADAHLTRAGAP